MERGVKFVKWKGRIWQLDFGTRCWINDGYELIFSFIEWSNPSESFKGFYVKKIIKMDQSIKDKINKAFEDV